MPNNTPEDKKEDRCRFLYHQLNNITTSKVDEDGRGGYTQCTIWCRHHFLRRTRNQFQTARAGNNLGARHKDEEEKLKFMPAYNEVHLHISVYQPGGTEISVREYMTKYTTTSSKDKRGLRRYYSHNFCVNPNHKWRVVVAYNICNGKPKGQRNKF